MQTSHQCSFQPPAVGWPSASSSSRRPLNLVPHPPPPLLNGFDTPFVTLAACVALTTLSSLIVVYRGPQSTTLAQFRDFAVVSPTDPTGRYRRIAGFDHAADCSYGHLSKCLTSKWFPFSMFSLRHHRPPTPVTISIPRLSPWSSDPIRTLSSASHRPKNRTRTGSSVARAVWRHLWVVDELQLQVRM